MHYQATAKYIRMSPRKIRLVADAIRSLSPKEALVALRAVARVAAKPLTDVISSAIANARSKQVDEEKLRFVTIEVMEGTGMKRFRAVSRGMAHAYKKRMTHVRIVLTDGGEEL